MNTTDWISLLAQNEGAGLLGAVVDCLRPSLFGGRSADLDGLVAALESSPESERLLERAVRDAVGQHRLVHALAESGILADRGILADLAGRLAARFLPLPAPEDDVRRLLWTVFQDRGDWRWVTSIPDEAWERVFRRFVHEADFVGIPHEDVAAAILGLAQRAGALGIDEELNARLHSVEDYDSPFLDLSPEARIFLDDHAEGRGSVETFEQLGATINRCRGLIEHLREHRGVYGTSLRLTAVTRRLLQQLRRMEMLVHVVHPSDGNDFAKSLVPVFKEIVEAELTSGNLARMVQGHADLFAFQITEETAKKGVKYVTDSSAGYWAFLRKAMVGGAIVAVFAVFKALLSGLDLSLGGRAVLYSLNYAACFVLIYLTGSILATKQPAMTASAIGRRIDTAESGEDAIEGVGEMVVRVWRSQFISFVGNLICAFPIAILIAWGAAELGLTIADEPKARKLVEEIDPVGSAALFFAAVAGVYLFASSVLSGWIDNHAVYTHLEERLRGLPWPESLRDRGERASRFIVDNLGVVSGNVILGFMLGTAGTLGYIFDVPFDIRHIAFSSANFGLAIHAAPELFGAKLAALCAAGVIGIGFVNFVVSFGLALATTLESRQSSFRDWRRLGACLARRFAERPRDWFLPPAEPAKAVDPGEPNA